MRGAVDRLAWLVVAVLLAACGPAAGEPPLVIMETDSAYAPASMSIPQGATIIWLNKDRLVHTVTASSTLTTSNFELAGALPAGAAPFDSGHVLAGQTWSYTFETPGEYLYYCRFHADEQMIGTIIVQASP